jgi:hypothetical protein
LVGLKRLTSLKEDPVEPYSQPPVVHDDFAATRTRMDEMLERLGGEMMSCTQEALEDYLTSAGRELLRQAAQDQLDARARAETRLAQVTGADSVVRRRAERGHRRALATTLGRLEVDRIAYRAPGAGNLHPADAVLSLAPELYSRPLQRMVVHEVATGSLRSADKALDRTTGQQLGTRQLMEVCRRSAADIPDFYRGQLAAAPVPAGHDLLVLSCDATGVNMIPADLRAAARAAARDRADEGPRPPSAQLSSRERTGRRRMATVTAVYDAAPAPRTPADILPATSEERAARRPGPRASGRTVDASLQHTAADMVTAMFDRATARDPGHQRRWIVLVDGANHQLDCIQQEATARGIVVDIVVDFIHVLEYLWKAAEDLHPGRPARTAQVAEHARAVLEGHSARVVADLRAQARTRRADGGPELLGLERAAAYLEAKEPYLAYHIALALGWPIATGVIEGCCRYLIKDRLDITGARWSLAGAEAVLLLRAVLDNGDFDAYWRYHADRDHQRHHTSRYQHEYAPAA